MVTSLKWIEKKIGYPSQSIYFYGIDEKEEKQIIFIAANASSYVICRRSSFNAFLSQQILFQRREKHFEAFNRQSVPQKRDRIERN
jgi:hypothetical protein